MVASCTANGELPFLLQLLPFLTALILLLLALALSKVHIKMSVSSPCIVVSSCCQSSGWLLSKQPHFVIQSLNLIMIACLTLASTDQALSHSASFSLSALILVLPGSVKPLPGWPFLSCMFVSDVASKQNKYLLLFSISLGDNAGTKMKPADYYCKRQWEQWIVQIQKQVGLQRTLNSLVCFLGFS